MQYRDLPSVDRVLQTIAAAGAAPDVPHAALVAAVREVLKQARLKIKAGGAPTSVENLAADASRQAAGSLQPRLRPVINASGVVLQTNLGRAPLSDAAIEAVERVARGYSNLEYDLDTGERGSRYHHMSATLARLAGAESALAVNNNAAAVLLVLSCLCAGREVVVSRGQAVEIGGGFRIPDVLRQSGATLIEVGTTNRTYARDYAEAIGEHTAAILTVHRSNFRMVGFTRDPEEHELAALARERSVLWLDDWGSGSLLQPGDFGLSPEPTVGDRVLAGCDLVCFSGDKLLGGPQAGLIVGKAALVERLRRHPLLRALRVDKMTVAAMEATLLSYVCGRAVEQLPVWRMISSSEQHLWERADRLNAALGARGVAARVIACRSAVGGGSTPGDTLPSVALALETQAPDRLHAALRSRSPAVVARIMDGQLLLDLRTVLHEQDAVLPDLIVEANHLQDIPDPASSSTDT